MYINDYQRERSVNRFVRRLPHQDCFVWDCWPMRTHRPDGYATYGDGNAFDTGEIYTHRIVATLIWGPIPPGMEVDHRCFTRNCVNPCHLQIISLQENRIRRKKKKAVKVYCPKGHEYTIVGRTTQGRCRLCQQQDMKAYHQAHREEQNAKRSQRRRRAAT